MKRLVAPDEKVLSILGTQKRAKGGICRLLSFCYSLDVPSGMLIYNTLTKELVHLDAEEKTSFLSNEDLFLRWFLVPEETDDLKLLENLFFIGRIIYRESQKNTSFVVLPTTACNARCFYCFEKGLTALNMSDETASATADFIMRNTSNKPVHIKWFGGEPLFHTAPIDAICQRIIDKVSFSSSITTNGFLLSQDILSKAKNLWHLKKIQITLDGPESVYNRVKNYIYPDTNAFKTVIENINAAVDYGFSLHLRLNIDKYNVNDMFDLVHYLAHNITHKSKILLYLAPLYESDYGFSFYKTEGERAALYASISQLESLIKESGFHTSHFREVQSFRFFSCIADNPHSIVVAPDGKLYRCEHIKSCKSVGSVFNSNDSTSSGIWETHYPFSNESCSHCPLLPTCIRPADCPNISICHPSIQSYREQQLTKYMLSNYSAAFFTE